MLLMRIYEQRCVGHLTVQWLDAFVVVVGAAGAVGAAGVGEALVGVVAVSFLRACYY